MRTAIMRSAGLCVTASIVLSGCTGAAALYSCVDGAIPRPFVTDRTFEVEIFDLNGSLVEHEVIRCEEYYDASCSARGNYYAFRQTPKSRQFSLPYGNDTIELEFPGCAQLVRNEELRPVYFTKYYRDSQTGQKWPLRLARDGSFWYRDGKNGPVQIEVLISAVKREVE